MTRRLATMCIMTMFLIGVRSSLTPAQGNEFSNATLKGISAISVLVEDLPDGAKVLGLTKESIQTDVELKLRLAGMTVVTLEESNSLPGRPYLYVFVNVTARPGAARIDVSLHQDARLERDGQRVIGVGTWETGSVIASPTGQGIRGYLKDEVDEFLNAWLSVNPKK